jgi:hypothetical protein
VTPPNLEKLRADLENIAAICRWESSKYEGIPANNEVTKELKSVTKHAGRLIAALEALNYRSRQAINNQAMLDIQNASSTEETGSDHSSLAVSIYLPEQEDCFMEMDLKTLLPVLRGLEKASVAGVGKARKSRPGQNPAFGLSLWMTNIENLWVEISQQPFRRDVTNDGEPITNAARFCVAAFRFVDPDMPSSRVLNAMRNSIQRHRKSTCRISVQNES